MDTPVTVAIISAAAAIAVSAVNFYLTKSKERQADWQRYKFELYKPSFQDEIGISNRSRDDDRNDGLLARPEWEIKDLRIQNNPPLSQFKARLWCLGSNPVATKTP